MSNEEQPILRIGVKLTVEVKAGLLVTAGGALPTAGEEALGPVLMDGKANERAAVTAMGVATCTSGAVIAAGAALKATARGKVETATANTTIVGLALEAASAADQAIRVLLIPNAHV